MPSPDAYPEMILAVAQEEIQALSHERSRRATRRAARSSRRGWPQNRMVRCMRSLFQL